MYMSETGWDEARQHQLLGEHDVRVLAKVRGE